MTDNPGVQETVAESQPATPEVEAQQSQEMNWQAAQQTMAEQKQALEQLKQQNQTYQQQLGVFQNYMNQQQASASQSSPLDSISDDDVITGGEMKRAMQSMLSEKERVFQEQMEAQKSQLAVMNLRSQYPDYENVVGNTLKMAENNPELAEAIRTSSNPALLAYQLGKATAPQANQQAAQAQRIVENSQKPGSATHAATGGSALSKVDYFMDMSDADFEAHVGKVKRGLL